MVKCYVIVNILVTEKLNVSDLDKFSKHWAVFIDHLIPPEFSYPLMCSLVLYTYAIYYPVYNQLLLLE